MGDSVSGTACSMVTVFFSVTIVGALKWHALQEMIF
jgi:hypothetical protein